MVKRIGKLTDLDFSLTPIALNNPKIRYASRGLVFNAEGKIALLNKVNKNEYKLPGGGFEENETNDQAFKREVKEEIGCELDFYNLIGCFEEERSQDNFIQFSNIYLAVAKHDRMNPTYSEKELEEGARVIWVSVQEALNLVENSMTKLKESKYEDLYNSRFIVKRDALIIRYYMDNLMS